MAATPETSLDRRAKRELRDGTWLSDQIRRHDHQLHFLVEDGVAVADGGRIGRGLGKTIRHNYSGWNKRQPIETGRAQNKRRQLFLFCFPCLWNRTVWTPEREYSLLIKLPSL